jgi:hypothetical protein
VNTDKEGIELQVPNPKIQDTARQRNLFLDWRLSFPWDLDHQEVDRLFDSMPVYLIYSNAATFAASF